MGIWWEVGPSERPYAVPLAQQLTVHPPRVGVNHASNRPRWLSRHGLVMPIHRFNCRSQFDQLGRSELNREQQTKEGYPWRRVVDDRCFQSKRPALILVLVMASATLRMGLSSASSIRRCGLHGSTRHQPG